MSKILIAAAILSVSSQLCYCNFQSAIVLLGDPSGSTKVRGQLKFTQTSKGVHISGEIFGLHTGKHGGHVHEFANISTSCAGTGPNYNPHNAYHGGPGDAVRSIGDLGNVVADRFGIARIDLYDDVIQLNRGVDGIIGRGFVIHEMEDDLGRGGDEDSKTTGHCGGLIACGVIGVLEE